MHDIERKVIFECGGKVYRIPGHMIDGLLSYIEDRIPQGSFLTAVLENKLVEAAHQADNQNMNALPAYANFLYNYAPRACWGSPEKVKAWLEGGKL